MRNPFQYGGIVGADAFCNRRKEIRDLQRAMENGEKLFIYSERRIGKTSLVQKRFLEGLAIEEHGLQPFAGDFVQRYRMGSASATQRVIKTLTDRDIIDRNNGSFIIIDRFFRLWIRRTQVM